MKKLVQNKIDELNTKLEQCEIMFDENETEDIPSGKDFLMDFCTQTLELTGSYLNDKNADEDYAPSEWMEAGYFSFEISNYIQDKEYELPENEFKQLLNNLYLSLLVDCETLDLILEIGDFELDYFTRTRTYQNLLKDKKDDFNRALELTNIINNKIQSKSMNIVVDDNSFDEWVETESFEVFIDESDVLELIINLISNDPEYQIIKTRISKSKYYDSCDFRSHYFRIVPKNILTEVLELQKIRSKHSMTFSYDEFQKTDYNFIGVRISNHYK